VVVPSISFFATVEPVVTIGATPVFCDVDEDTWCMTAATAEPVITERTKALVPVHLYGNPAPIEELVELARPRGIRVLEDAAQAHGARCDGRRAGSLGDAAAFSFYPTKNLGAIGDGGAVTTDDEALADRVRVLRNYGMRDRYRIESDGVNSRLAEIQAAVLRAKLPHLDADNAARAALAERYRVALSSAEELSIPRVPDRTEPVWHLFMVGHPQRDDCLEALRGRGVAALVHYPVLPHAAPQYRDAGGGPDSVAVAERLCARALSLPMYPQLDPGRCEEVAEAVLQTLRPEA
jgi:dTDP-3-amino-3,4,6-trideoxy-alpha-D-glucose transaminase